MRKLSFYSVIAFLIISLQSCKKSSKDAEVTYEVTTLSAPSWHGAYINENAQVIGITAGMSGWRYTFKNSNHLSMATLQAYPDGTSSLADAIMKIYVNGNVVASSKASVYPQVQYIFP